MRRRHARRSRIALGVVCGLLFAGLVGAGFAVASLDVEQREAAEDQLVYAEVATIRSRLEHQLYSTVSLARGLEAYVAAQPDLGDPARLRILLGTLTAQGRHIRNIGIAPDDVVTVVHPVEGNEAALGLDYSEDVPAQYGAVMRARRTRSSVLAGPIDLVQGGRGLINHTPVFVDGDYWGVLSLVIDVDSLVADASDVYFATPIDWAIRTRKSYDDGKFLAGDPGLFDRADVRLRFDVPDGTWEIAAVSTEPSTLGRRQTAGQVASVVLAAIVALLVFEVVRERWRAIELSLRDPLTGLANRRLLEDRVERALAAGQREGRPFLLALMDLDGFKAVNDRYGHRAGDEVLRTIATRLRERTRASDTVARVGGDEFVLLLSHADPAAADRLAAELEAVSADPIPWDGQQLWVGASVGMAAFPRDARDEDGLLRVADDRMYAAKARRRSVAGTVR